MLSIVKNAILVGLCLGAISLTAFAQAENGAPNTTSTTASTEIIYLSAKEAKALLETNSDIQVLDIRTPEEFNAGHMDGAKSINFYDDDFATQVSQLDKTTPYLVHCASGGRSGKSLETFKEAGFETVYHLDGGYRAWAKLD